MKTCKNCIHSEELTGTPMYTELNFGMSREELHEYLVCTSDTTNTLLYWSIDNNETPDVQLLVKRDFSCSDFKETKR